MCMSPTPPTRPIAAAEDHAARRAAFQKLHQDGCFVLPNPWDVGSARYLRHLGFPAVATTSAGFAFSRGLPDSERAVPLEAVLGHFAEIVAGVDVPVNADFGGGYAREPEQVAENVLRCVATGVAGLSIEDSTGDPGRPLHELPLAVERIRAARAAIDASGSGVLLTGRAECFLVGHPDPLAESIRRLEAYAAAGAHVLYAPGLATREAMKAVVSAVAPRPVNVLVGSNLRLRVDDLAELGVRRISVGSALARAAWAGFMRAANAIREHGDFSGFDSLAPGAELNRLFQSERGPRADP
jgi:2-methylisocitrate lyase-like PEP mutase family enzyme